MVSESGIKNRHDIEKLKQWGVDAVLIGESLMSAPDIAAKMKELSTTTALLLPPAGESAPNITTKIRGCSD